MRDALFVSADARITINRSIGKTGTAGEVHPRVK